MTETNQNEKDSESLKLRTFINQFTSRRYNRFASRKVVDETRKDLQGETIVTKARVEKVPMTIRQFYYNEVCMRNRPYQPIAKAHFDAVSDFLTNPQSRPWLMMMGTPGTGKSTMLKAIRNTFDFLYDEDYEKPKMNYCKASQLGGIMKNDPERFRRICGSEVLFVDDLGFLGESEVVNDYGVKRRPIEAILEGRYDSMSTTVFTTNLTRQELYDRYGERIHSRLCEMCMFIMMTGQDYRQLKISEK